jgi:hypothetical protein
MLLFFDCCKPYHKISKFYAAVASKLSKIFWLFLATVFNRVAKVRAFILVTKII